MRTRTLNPPTPHTPTTASVEPLLGGIIDGIACEVRRRTSSDGSQVQLLLPAGVGSTTRVVTRLAGHTWLASCAQGVHKTGSYDVTPCRTGRTAWTGGPVHSTLAGLERTRRTWIVSLYSLPRQLC